MVLLEQPQFWLWFGAEKTFNYGQRNQADFQVRNSISQQERDEQKKKLAFKEVTDFFLT